jgi:site-specific recombinase
MANLQNQFDVGALLDDVEAALDAGDRLESISRLFAVLRAGPAEGTDERLAELCEQLEERRALAHRIGNALRALLSELRIGPALTESGVSSPTGFFSEMGRRLVGKVLPYPEEEDDLRTAIRIVFAGSDDHRRIERVPEESWIRLLERLGITEGEVSRVDPALEAAVRALAQHAGSLGLHPEFTRRLPQLGKPDSPFLCLPDRILAYVRVFDSEGEVNRSEMLEGALDTIERCRSEVQHLRETKGTDGTSLELTGITFRLVQLLDRLELLLRLADPSTHAGLQSAVRLFRSLVRAETTRNQVAPLIQERADLLAVQVVEQAAKKGGKYITTTRREYGAFFVASLGGGAWVALFSFFKLLMGRWELAPGVEAIVYGLNYSVCFVLIYLTGAALATKQPALTANTIARALGDRQNRHLEQLEAVVVRVWRSQFVSFAGNLAMALPLGFLISLAFDGLTGDPVAGAEQAESMLAALHPWRSGTLPFAALAGVFLFLAGLLSGWVDNRILYSHIPERVTRHPVLISLLGRNRTEAVADFVDRKLGAIVGNVFLGFALGSTASVGEIIGLPLDIRHIAFASAEFGTSMEILRFDVALGLLWTAALGVFLIGLLNFVVSFGLSLVTGFVSRRITLREIRVLASHLATRFVQRPLDWFFPPRGAGDGEGSAASAA